MSYVKLNNILKNANIEIEIFHTPCEKSHKLLVKAKRELPQKLPQSQFSPVSVTRSLNVLYKVMTNLSSAKYNHVTSNGLLANYF